MSNLEHLVQTLKKTTLTGINRKIGNYDEIISTLVEYFIEIKNNKNTIYFIGNGGSAAISMHMTVDFLKNGNIRTHDMHAPAVLTCLGNDFGYDQIFSKQIEMIAEPYDLLVAISSSGESSNILNAVKVAHEKKCKIITFSGFKESNSLSLLGDLNVYVPNMNYGTVESIHNIILQDVVDEIKKIDDFGERI